MAVSVLGRPVPAGGLADRCSRSYPVPGRAGSPLRCGWAAGRLPLQWLISGVGLMAWIVWGWTCLFVILRIALNVLDAATRGAAWVDSLRKASDWLTLPIVRRAVDVSLAGLLVARVAAIPAAAAAQAAPPAAAMIFSG